MIDLVTCVHIR